MKSTQTFYTSLPQGQYWAGRTPPNNNGPPNMAAANFVITNGEGCALNGTAVAAVFIDQ